MQGTYQLSSSTVNGRPLWTLTLSGLENITIGNSPFSGDKLDLGIWYLPKSKRWTIGALKDLEKGPFLQGGIVSKNIEFHDNPQNIRHWYYYDEGYKSPTDVNDIILECIDCQEIDESLDDEMLRAARQNDTEKIETLIKNCGDVNAATRTLGNTVLMYSAQSGNKEIANLLIEKCGVHVIFKKGA